MQAAKHHLRVLFSEMFVLAFPPVLHAIVTTISVPLASVVMTTCASMRKMPLGNHVETIVCVFQELAVVLKLWKTHHLFVVQAVKYRLRVLVSEMFALAFPPVLHAIRTTISVPLASVVMTTCVSMRNSLQGNHAETIICVP